MWHQCLIPPPPTPDVLEHLPSRSPTRHQSPTRPRIVDIQLGHLPKRLASRNLKLDVSDHAKKLLADEGYDPAYGARPLKRVIQQRIENPLAGEILTGKFSEGQTVHVDADPSKRTFKFSFDKTIIEGELAE